MRNLYLRVLTPLSLSFLLISAPAVGELSDVSITDVTTRAFSVVWVSDEPVVSATVRVFNDAQGSDEVTVASGLQVMLVSQAFPPALEQGIVKVDITGLAADTSYHVRTETTTATGLQVRPQNAPLIEVTTARQTRKANELGEPIVNDLILHEIRSPDGGPSGAALLLVKVPSLSPYPLSAFVGEGFPAPAAVVDFNNLFDQDEGSSAAVPEGAVLEMREWRGRRCPLGEQELLRYRRVPVQEESPPITELKNAAECFFADTVCDGTVDIRDVQRVLNVFNEQPDSCRYNADLDIAEIGVINIRDVQSVLNRFGQDAPFE